MRIGFDAKRFFHNTTGLGNYSRTLVNGLANYYPQHEYILFNPKPVSPYSLPAANNTFEVNPAGFLSITFPSLWRSVWMCDDIRAQKLDLFHGLSHELPKGIGRSGVKSVVTIHDLIFERYPEQYGSYEVRMHRHKIQHACRFADVIIAASEHTKKDLAERYKVSEEKVVVAYQSCDPVFSNPPDFDLQAKLRLHYHLPDRFFLYVGSIIERKNLLGICEAMQRMPKESAIPLVIVGTGTGVYMKKLEAYIAASGLEKRILFLSKKASAPAAYNISHTNNLAALYQMSTALVYPSFFEGFGIPVLEALTSGVPAITSRQTSMEEISGDAACLISPGSAEEIATAMMRLQNDEQLRASLSAKGRERAKAFSLQNCTDHLMNIYQKVVGNGSF